MLVWTIVMNCLPLMGLTMPLVAETTIFKNEAVCVGTVSQLHRKMEEKKDMEMRRSCIFRCVEVNNPYSHVTPSDKILDLDEIERKQKERNKNKGE